MSQFKIRKRLITLLIILVFAFPMTALLFSPEYPTSNKTLYDYVALGDSYSAGQTPFGDPEGTSYTDMIKDKLAYAGILGSYHKKGVSGYKTTDVLGQLPLIKGLLYDAEIVTLDIGLNDIQFLAEFEAYQSNPSSKNYDAAQAAVKRKIAEVDTNIRVIITEIKAANPYFDPQIYVMGYFNAFPNLPALLPFIEQLNAAINDAAMENGAIYVDTMAAIDENLEDYFPGDIHPTVEGYRAIAEEFWKSMNKELLMSVSAHKLPTDIQGHWAEDTIKKYVDKGIVKGYEDGSFKPDNALTRAEFITIINKYFRLIAETNIDFTDVPENAWYRKEIQKAVKEGYLSGYNDNSFRADQSVSRQEAAVIIAKMMKFERSEEGNETARFQDGGDIPAWSRDSVNALVRYEILKGYPGDSIRYNGNLTRAEALSIFDSISAYIKNHVPEG